MVTGVGLRQLNFTIGLYTVKLSEPENTMFGARIGGEPLYKPSYSQFYAQITTTGYNIANKGRPEVSLADTIRLVDPKNLLFDARTLYESSMMSEL